MQASLYSTTASLAYCVGLWQVWICPRCCDRVIYHATSCTWRLECHCGMVYAMQPNGLLMGVPRGYTRPVDYDRLVAHLIEAQEDA